jgi:hypothetical protein
MWQTRCHTNAADVCCFGSSGAWWRWRAHQPISRPIHRTAHGHTPSGYCGRNRRGAARVRGSDCPRQPYCVCWRQWFSCGHFKERRASGEVSSPPVTAAPVSHCCTSQSLLHQSVTAAPVSHCCTSQSLQEDDLGAPTHAARSVDQPLAGQWLASAGRRTCNCSHSLCTPDTKLFTACARQSQISSHPMHARHTAIHSLCTPDTNPIATFARMASHVSIFSLLVRVLGIPCVHS